MKDAITLAREAGMGGDAFGWLASNHAIEKFYTLARADLEAECERRKTQFASAEFAINELKAANEKLREALAPFTVTNSSSEHMYLFVRTADITAARAALGETK